MKTLALTLALVAAPTPATAPSSSTRDGDAVTVRVTSALGEEEDNDQVREVVSQRVAAVLADEGYAVEDGAPRLLLIRVGRSEERPTDYRVQLSASGDTESAPKRVETFECSCSAPELLDELDRRLATHIPAIFEEPEPELAFDTAPEPPAPAPAPAPAPGEDPPAPIEDHPTKSWPPHQDTALFAAGVSTIGVGGCVLVGVAIGFPIAIADEHDRVPNIAYVTPALGVAAIVTGAILLRVNKKRHSAHLTSVAPLSGRF